MINLKYPIYDVYIYHSVYRSTNVPNNTEFKILVQRKNFNNGDFIDINQLNTIKNIY